MFKWMTGALVVVMSCVLVLGAETKPWLVVIKNEIKASLIGVAGEEEVRITKMKEEESRRSREKEQMVARYETDREQAAKRIIELQKRQVESMLKAREANLEMEKAKSGIGQHVSSIEKVNDVLANPAKHLLSLETRKPFTVVELKNYIAEKQNRIEELKANMKSSKSIADLHMQNAATFEQDWRALLKNAQQCKSVVDRIQQRQEMLVRLKNSVESAINDRIGIKSNNTEDVTMSNQLKYWQKEETSLNDQVQGLMNTQNSVADISEIGQSSIDNAIESMNNPVGEDVEEFAKRTKDYVNSTKEEIN